MKIQGSSRHTQITNALPEHDGALQHAKNGGAPSRLDRLGGENIDDKTGRESD
jgi:hypothetical protein